MDRQLPVEDRGRLARFQHHKDELETVNSGIRDSIRKAEKELKYLVDLHGSENWPDGCKLGRDQLAGFMQCARYVLNEIMIEDFDQLAEDIRR